jgi:hypothetical protein
MSVILYETLTQEQLRGCLRYVGCEIDEVDQYEGSARATGVHVIQHDGVKVTCEVTLHAREGLCLVDIVTANTPCTDVEGEYVSLANWQCGNARAVVNLLERSFSQIAYDVFGETYG